MDQHADLSPSLRPDDCLLTAYIKNTYYHLRLRKEYQLYLAFRVGGVNYIPACQNCGLPVAPWFFTKAMRPLVEHLLSRGHRVYSYLDDLFGAAASAREEESTSQADTQNTGRDISALFRRLGLWLRPKKCEFSGQRELEVLGRLVNTRRAMLLISPGKLRKLEIAARRLLAHVASHRRHDPARALRSFAGLGNSTNLAVVDARLRLRESFDALAVLSNSNALLGGYRGAKRGGNRRALRGENKVCLGRECSRAPRTSSAAPARAGEIFAAQQCRPPKTLRDSRRRSPPPSGQTTTFLSRRNARSPMVGPFWVQPARWSRS
jgi:Reverse transcriptase (RNA-dependent DNA polymerase)